MKKVVFTFGRYNPPTKGHAELITYAVKYAQQHGAEHRIYTSQSHDPAKNPLSAAQKIRFLKQIFPGVNFVADRSAITAFAICRKLADEGYDDVTFVVGDDRVADFRTQLSKYVKPKTAKDYNPKIHYPFKKFQVISSGARKKGISGTDLRAAVRKGDFATFAKASAATDKTLARKIFDTTRAQLNEQMINEEMGRKEFSDHLNSFVDFCCGKLGIEGKPTLKFKEPTDQGEQPSFGGYNPSSNEIIICTKNRHPMDVFRTLAHELVHHKQNEDGRIKDVAKEGATGSSIEDEANSMAGRLMRWFGKSNPDKFALSHIVESKYINEGSLHKWFKSRSSDGKAGWVQIGGKYQGKPCARQPGQKSTPKCRSSDEASRMTDAEIKYAVRKKRKEDPNQHMKKNAAEPTRVATYKRKKMNEEKDVKGKGSGKKDACYYKVKARYDVWPSAYASGALVKCRQKGADNWGKKSVDEEFDSLMEAKKTKAKPKKAKKAVNTDKSVFLFSATISVLYVADDTFSNLSYLFCSTTTSTYFFFLIFLTTPSIPVSSTSTIETLSSTQ